MSDDVIKAEAANPNASNSGAATGATPMPSPPSDAFLVIPVRSAVFFPEIVAPITVGRSQTVAAAQQAVREQRQVIIVLQRDPDVAEPGMADLYPVGVVCN